MPFNNCESKSEQTKTVTVNIISESDAYYEISGHDGLVTFISRTIINANHLAPSNGRITLPESIYNHYFLKEHYRIDKLWTEVLIRRFPDVMANQDLVISNPEYANIRSDYFVSGGMWIGSISYPLGSLLESWKHSDNLTATLHDGMVIKVARVGGSALSGTIFACRGWCEEQNKLVAPNSLPLIPILPNGFGVWYRKFRNLPGAGSAGGHHQTNRLQRLLIKDDAPQTPNNWPETSAKAIEHLFKEIDNGKD